MRNTTRVLVVDDSAYSRQTIRKMLLTSPAIEVVGVATSGMDAMVKVVRLRPDVITLDFEMPEMDGFTFLRWLMLERPTPVIMLSSYADKKTVFKALELGAVDFIAKPSKRASAELRNIEKDLLSKVLGIKGLNMALVSRNVNRLESRSKKRKKAKSAESEIEAVAVGCSTGGPPALQLILQSIPSDFPSAMVISQHMPRGFTKPLAERLNKLAGLSVKEAESGDPLRGGSVLICPGGYHMTFRRRGGTVRVVLREAEGEDKYVPSTDIMMESAVDVFDKRLVGVVLTGMGNDGTRGMVGIKSAGGYTIVESEATAVVYGMPAEVVKAGAAREVLPLDRISGGIIRAVMGERRL